jgi:subtilisin family serine protease
MKIYRLLSILVMLAMLFGSSSVGMGKAQAKPQRAEISPDALYVPGEVIVAFRSGFATMGTQAAALDLASQVGAQVAEVAGDTALLQFDESANVPELVAQLNGMQGVAYAEPNYIRWIPEMQMDPTKVVGHPQPRTEVTFRLRDARGGGTHEIKLSLSQLRSMKSIRNGLAVPTWPTDPGVWWQWGWEYSDANLVWPDKAPNPAVCVVDTGVDKNHPDLKGRVLPGYDFVNEDSDPADDNGHGTHVSGTIAAAINNKKGFAGISTAKIVPAKVLSAQSLGTAFDIAQGIRYCADNSAVKVINMSLSGGGPSITEYDALDYAINSKGKLVVAAAGNSSRAYYDVNGDNAITPGTDGAYLFPAGWAVDWVCKNGILAPGAPNTANCAPGNANTLAPGLISVAAANFWNFWYDSNNDGLVWVDTDGDGSEPIEGDPDYWDEHFWPAYCAAEFSNYGAWVEIIAPGKDIYSTVPVSYYNYYGKSFWGADPDGDGYDWWSGTSMAAPHVAGAAARVWSVFPTETNFQIETRLAHGGISMRWRQVAMDPNMTKPWRGYDDTGYRGEAPFCWPNNTFGALYDMTNVPYLDVAGAMRRTAFFQQVSEAITGLPLAGATVMAYSGTTLKDRAIVSADNHFAALINLPVSLSYSIKVNKAGYTSGAVDIYPGSPQNCWPGFGGCYLYLSIPPKGRITAVLNWAGGDYNDLDLYTWLPIAYAGVVGAGGSGHPQDKGAGELSTFPFARRNYDGGWTDWLGAESITIMPKPGSLTIPYYNLTSADRYDFFVTDYGSGALNQDVFFRLWANGQIVPGSFVAKSATCDTDGADNTPGNTDDEVWWHVGYIQFSTFTKIDQCGPAGTPFWPY